MRYLFDHIDNGQLGEGYTVLVIRGGETEAGTPEERALAERYGGRPAPVKSKVEGPKGAAEPQVKK
jgi:hypothetical protein